MDYLYGAGDSYSIQWLAESLVGIKFDAIDDNPNRRLAAIRHVKDILKQHENEPSALRTFHEGSVVGVFIAPLKEFIHHQDVKILEDVLIVVRYFIEIGEEERQLLVDQGIIKTTISLLDHIEPKVKIAALSLVNVFLLLSPQSLKYALECGVMNFISKNLMHSHQDVYGLALEMLPIFLSDVDNDSSDILDENLIRSLIHLLDKYDTKNKALILLTSVPTWGKPEQIVSMVDLNAIQAVCKLLDSEKNVVVGPALTLLNRTLQKIGNQADRVSQIIKECGGIEKIKRHQKHNNKNVVAVADELIDKLFST